MKAKPLPIKLIPLALIDHDDRTYCLVPIDAPPDQALSRHIARIGILHPPVVKEGPDGNLVIVAGRKRLKVAADHLKWTSCDCLVLGPEFDPLSTLALALDEALLRGPVSPLVKAIFCKKAVALCPPDEAARRFLPLFGLTPHPVHLGPILALSGLEHPLALALHEGRLEEKTAFALSTLSFRDRFALFDLIDTLHLSVGNQRKVMTICQDLAKRQGSSIHAILADQELHEIIDHPGSNPPQKTTQVMAALSRQHAPNLTAAEKRFSALTQRLSLPKGLALNHAPAFERDEVTLTATFPDQEAFSRVWPELSALLKTTAPGRRADG